MNFEIILIVIASILSIFWLFERIWYKPRSIRTDNSVPYQRPFWLEMSAGLFPVFFVVLIFRSFLVEPFQIPTGSMIPTLLPGDYILVNKFRYGLRLPIVGTPIVPGKPVARGDVIVFRYPLEPKTNYIKRVIGVGGDKISYKNKSLEINNQPINSQTLPAYQNAEDGMTYDQLLEQFEGQMPNHHQIIRQSQAKESRSYNFGLNTDCDMTPNLDYCASMKDIVLKACTIEEGVGYQCNVPPGYYLVMGDNRDNSADSRYWGFVPENNIVGKAFLIWLNFKDLKRSMTSFH